MNDQSGDATRREFLQRAMTATAVATISTKLAVAEDPAATTADQKPVAANDKITIGVIGIGNRASFDLGGMLSWPDVQCAAIADVQSSRRDAGKALVDKMQGNDRCAVHADFRELLDRKDIDAVLIATGDRWHAAASILAAEAGKDIYSEKPCGITIADCEQVEETMQRTKRVYQAGTQRRSVANFQQAVELAQNGKLGKLKTLYASVYIPTLKNDWLPAEPTPPREVCDWNLWLGPAPWRPYNAAYPRGEWRGYYDFDSGARLLDWGAHTVDLCQWANKADDTLPLTYEPSEENIKCRYANGVELVLDFLPQPFGDRGPRWITRLGTCPVKFVGEAGSVETGDSGELVITPDSLQSEAPKIEKNTRGLDVAAHARNFFDAIKTREQTIANPTVMRHSHIACHAAALAWILKRKLTIDPAKNEFVDDDEANGLRSRAARRWSNA